MKGPRALVELHATVFDLVPRAMAVRAAAPGALDPAWRRGASTYVLPRPGLHDHWECAATPEPWMFLEAPTRGPTQVGIQIEGAAGLTRLGGVLEPAQAGRFEALLAAAGRFEPDAETVLVRSEASTQGVVTRAVPGRAVVANALGRELLLGLLEAGLGTHGPGIGLRLVQVPLPPDDRLAWRRAVARTVDLWRSVWALPPPRVDASADELERRLGAAYRRSLRLVAGSADAAERGALRAEARALAADYRAAGRVRPRLLDVLTHRLGLL